MRFIRNKKTLTVLFAIVLAVIVYLAWPNPKAAAPGSAANTAPKATSPSGSSFNKSLYSTADPSSLWVIVNKKHSLSPTDYVPPDLTVPAIPLREPGNESMRVRRETARALEQMFAAAQKDGLQLQLSSGYRSYAYQQGTYGGYVKQNGQAYADTISARPGFSEHQTGLAADIEPVSRQCEIIQCFETTPEGKWLAANSYKYGFIMRYPADKVAVTGYDYEPWHFRYVGTYLSQEMHREKIDTMEEFFGVSGGTNY